MSIKHMLDRNEIHIEIQLPFYDISHHVCANTSKSEKKMKPENFWPKEPQSVQVL